MSEKTQNKIYPELIALSKVGEVLDFISTGSIRQLRFYNTDNFNEKCVRAIGNRLYLKTDAFFDWIEEVNKKQAV